MRAGRVLIWGWLWALVSCTQKLGPDIFSRARILDCGRVLERDAWPAMDWRAPFGEWEEIARELNIDPVATREGAGNLSVYYAVALMQDQPSRVEHTRRLLAEHPRWRVYNSSSKYDLTMMYAHWRGMGLKMRNFKVTLGKVAWWWTCIRFCMLVLGSGHDFGVMLNDDVQVVPDFEETLEGHLARLTLPMRFATYRLGQFDLGLVISKEAAARQLGIICELRMLDHFHDHFTIGTHRFLPDTVGNCPITYTGVPIEGMAHPEGDLHAKSNILSGGDDHGEGDFFQRVRWADRGDRPSFCTSEYPGRIHDLGHLGAWVNNATPMPPLHGP